jgi:hypothetical protein
VGDFATGALSGSMKRFDGLLSEREMNDRAGHFRRVGGFGDKFEVADVLTDGCSFGVTGEQAAERASRALPAFRERLEAGVVRKSTRLWLPASARS